MRPGFDPERTGLRRLAAWRLALREQARTDGPALPAPGAVLRAVLDPDPLRDAPLHAARARLPALEALYRDLLARHALVTCERLAAASDGTAVPARQGPGYRIRIEDSTGRPGLCYLLIEIDQGRPPPRFLDLLPEPPAPAPPPLPLPAPGQGRIQLLRPADDPLVLGLRDWRLRIALR